MVRTGQSFHAPFLSRRETTTDETLNSIHGVTLKVPVEEGQELESRIQVAHN